MIDRSTKALMFAIAVGLWANLATAWLQPTVAHAQTDPNLLSLVSRIEMSVNALSTGLSRIESTMNPLSTGLSGIESNVSAMSVGKCANPKIC